MKQGRRKPTVDKPDKKPTSFRLDPELLRQAQHFAIDHDLTLVEMVEEGLRRVIKEGRK